MMLLSLVIEPFKAKFRSKSKMVLVFSMIVMWYDSYETSQKKIPCWAPTRNTWSWLFPIEVPSYLGSGRLGALRPVQADREALADLVMTNIAMV